MTQEEQQLIDAIFDIRVENNNPWKELIEIAMNHAPEDAKNALRRVCDNDAHIAHLTRMLTK